MQTDDFQEGYDLVIQNRAHYEQSKNNIRLSIRTLEDEIQNPDSEMPREMFRGVVAALGMIADEMEGMA